MQVLKEEIRQNILSAALDIFSSVGYEAATMKQIAESAGIAKSNLYRYYQSKSEIFHAVADIAMKEIRRSIMGSLTDCFALPKTDADRIRAQLQITQNKDKSNEIWKDPRKFYIEVIFPILYSKRKQILLILKLNDSMGRREYVTEITGILEYLFSLSQNLDMPDGFSRVMANSLISNVIYIFSEYETKEELSEYFTAIIQYHSCGVKFFSNKKEEGDKQ